MGIRSLVLLSFVVTAFSLSSTAQADVPPGTGGGTSATTTTGAGGGSATDPNCTVDVEMTAGSTCEACSTGKGSAPSGTKACSSLDSTYFLACSQSAAVQVWCNGPQRLSPSDQNVAKCSTTAPGGSWSALGLTGALAAVAALRLRRRKS